MRYVGARIKSRGSLFRKNVLLQQCVFEEAKVASSQSCMKSRLIFGGKENWKLQYGK